ncbi:MAG: hypothetical protein ACKOTZ_06545 [Chloroflexota bacterium]
MSRLTLSRRRATTAAALLLAAVAALPGTPALAGTEPSENAWVVVRKPLLAAYEPAARDRWNSAGGAIAVVRVDTGQWDVTIPGQSALATDNGGHVQVTALGDSPAICSADYWVGLGTAIVVRVRCEGVGGGAKDSKFSLGWVHEGYDAGTNPTFGYVYLDNPNLNSGTPRTDYQQDVAGGTITFTSSAMGAHQMRFPNVEELTYATLTPYGSPLRCRIVSWYPDGSDVVVATSCGGSVPTDKSYLLYASRNEGPLGFGPDGATAWANQPRATRPYRPSASYRYSSRRGSPVISRTSTGVYTVRFPNQLPGGAAFVSAYGSSDRTCQAGSIARRGASASVVVRCFDPAGALANAQFTIGWVR